MEDMSLEEERDSKEEVFEAVKWAFYIVPFVALGVTIILNMLVALIAIPKYAKIFADMLGAEPLPFLTELTFNYSTYALSIDFIFVVVLIYVCKLCRLKYFLITGSVFIAISLLKAVLCYASLMLPFWTIMDKLGQ